jgi:hypothetical protein
MTDMMHACYRPSPSGRKQRPFIWQAVEKVRQLRSRLIEILNVPSRGYASGFDLPAALLNSHFEQPAG